MASMQADHDWNRHRRLIGWGIAGLLLLIGVAIVTGVVVRAIVGPAAGFGYFPFFFFPFGFFIFVFFLFFLFRGLVWGWGGWGGRAYAMYGRKVSPAGAGAILRGWTTSGDDAEG